MGSVRNGMGLPGRFGETGDVAVDGKLPEADTAETEETHVPVLASAELTAIVGARLKFSRPLLF